MSSQPSSFDFQQILLLTEDDPDFRKELMDSYRSSFESFPAEYAETMRKGNVDELRFLVHRVKASVRMVGADELDRILEQSPRLLEQQTDLQPTIDRVAVLCSSLVAAMSHL